MITVHTTNFCTNYTVHVSVFIIFVIIVHKTTNQSETKFQVHEVSCSGGFHFCNNYFTLYHFLCSSCPLCLCHPVLLLAVFFDSFCLANNMILGCIVMQSDYNIISVTCWCNVVECVFHLKWLQSLCPHYLSFTPAASLSIQAG